MKLASKLLTAAVAAVLGTAVAAQEIKISHQFKANTDGRDQAAREFVKAVNAKDSNVKFRIYPAQSLGIKPVAQLDALQNGTLEMAVFPMSYAVGKAQEFSIVIMPGTIPTLDYAMKLKGTPFHKKLQDLAHANGIHIVTWWWTPGAFATKGREITTPKSVDGLKMRAADPTFEVMLRAAGASVTSMPSTEIYPALQSGVLDGALTSAETFVSMRLYEQTKHATTPGKFSLWMLLQPLVMSKQHWDKLTPAQQKLFVEAADKADQFFLNLQRDAVKDMEAAFKKAGAKIHEMTESEYKQWVELAKETAWKEYASKSPTAKELLDTLLAVK